MKKKLPLWIAAALMATACGVPHQQSKNKAELPANSVAEDYVQEEVEITSNEAAYMEPASNSSMEKRAMVPPPPPQQRNRNN